MSFLGGWNRPHGVQALRTPELGGSICLHTCRGTRMPGPSQSQRLRSGQGGGQVGLQGRPGLQKNKRRNFESLPPLSQMTTLSWRRRWNTRLPLNLWSHAVSLARSSRVASVRLASFCGHAHSRHPIAINWVTGTPKSDQDGAPAFESGWWRRCAMSL